MGKRAREADAVRVALLRQANLAVSIAACNQVAGAAVRCMNRAGQAGLPGADHLLGLVLASRTMLRSAANSLAKAMDVPPPVAMAVVLGLVTDPPVNMVDEGDEAP